MNGAQSEKVDAQLCNLFVPSDPVLDETLAANLRADKPSVSRQQLSDIWTL
jgi:hypothetical protein